MREIQKKERRKKVVFAAAFAEEKDCKRWRNWKIKEDREQ